MSKITFKIIEKESPISFKLLKIEKKWWWYTPKTTECIITLNVHKNSLNFYDTLSYVDYGDYLEKFFKNKFIPVKCHIDLIKRDAKQFMSDDEFFELETGLDEIEGTIVEAKDYADYIENHIFKNKNISFKIEPGFISYYTPNISYFKPINI